MPECYSVLVGTLCKSKDYTEIPMLDFIPKNQYERREWLQDLIMPFGTKLYTEIKAYGNIHYSFWCDDDNIHSCTTCIHRIKSKSTVHTLQQMRKIIPFFTVMRSLHRFLTGDSSAPVNQNKADVDQRLMEFLIISGDAKVAHDIREPTIGE